MPLEMRPGDSRSPFLGVIECSHYFAPAEARATPSVDPSAGARMDLSTGVFTVDGGTPSGSVLPVSADVEKGCRRELHSR